MKGKALLAGAIALAMSSMAMAEDIKIAVVGAMSGPVAQYGDQEFTGAEQAVADINAKGGIKGNKLVITKYDDACDPKQAVAVANKVVNDGVKYVIGHLCSSSTQPASDIYEDEGILMITPAATAPYCSAMVPARRWRACRSKRNGSVTITACRPNRNLTRRNFNGQSD
ncbi:Branched-chain amino acid ABC transporter, amino acid-binding protein (TC 3.A.1.4.1) [Cronobacter universalis NCTC 9529]|nr:Branched-chain amino acid ABC transporter, amino acid-binding protein (TC 3.A.1.4.1) [Cronobacter universalis NCTC 9529]